MTQLLEDKDYIKLGANDLMNKAAEVIKKRDEGNIEEKNVE